MFGLGTQELVVILGISFLVFGGKKLPEIGAGLGTAIRSFKKELDNGGDSAKVVAKELPRTEEGASAKE